MEVYKNIEAAFYAINYRLLFSNQTKAIAHDYNVEVLVNPEIGKEIDFTKLVNYTSTKRDGLISNYLDFLDLSGFTKKVHARIGKKHWAETMKFSHNTIAREACLISATPMNNGDRNELFIHVRTSEVYKRLMMDLLLFKRLGDLLFDGHAYIIHIFINHVWLSKDWASMLLVKRDIRIKCKKSSDGTIAHRAYIQYKKFKATHWKDLTYNAHKRAVRVITKDVHDKRLTSDDCLLSW